MNLGLERGLLETLHLRHNPGRQEFRTVDPVCMLRMCADVGNGTPVGGYGCGQTQREWHSRAAPGRDQVC